MKNYFIIAPVIAAIALAGYLLYKDYHSNQSLVQNATDREIIGEVIFRENKVMRQLSMDVLWNSIEKKEPVYNLDSIRTGKDSSAAIKLTDNTLIEINESSLIVFDKSQSNLKINFKAGDISTKNSTDHVQIQVKDSVVKAQGAEVNIKTGTDDKTKIQVTKGKAIIQDKNKKSVEMTENEATSLGDEGAGEVFKIAVQLKSPENKAHVTSNEQTLRYAFTWTVLNPAITAEFLEISPNPRFTKETVKSLRSHQAITAPVISGLQYWRVGWDDGKHGRQYSETRELTVGKDKRLELVYPENQTSFDFTPEENSLEMQWKSLIAAKAFILDVARSMDFKIIVNSQTIKGQEGELKASVKNLEGGTYYWRVRAFGEKNDLLGTSGTGSFTIKLKLPALPELIKPAHDATWSDPTPVTFMWKKMDKASEYRIIISADMDQKSVIKTQILKENQFLWPSKVQQIIYWGVVALNSKSQIVGKSEIRKLLMQQKKISPAFMAVYPRDQFEVQRDLAQTNIDPVLFQWKITRPLPGAVLLEVSTEEEFKNPMKFPDLKKFSQVVKLEKEGKYYWRLSSQPEVSEVYAFTLKKVSIIAPPILVAPEDKEKIENQDTTVVKFTWNGAKDAVQYHIVVEKTDPKTSEKKTVMDKVVGELTASSPPLPEGQYQWSVSSMDKDGQEGTAGRVRQFFLVPVEQMNAPTLNNPVVK